MFIIWNCDQQGYHYFLDVIDSSDTVEPLDHDVDLGLFVKHVSSAKDQKGWRNLKNTESKRLEICRQCHLSKETNPDCLDTGLHYSMM